MDGARFAARWGLPALWLTLPFTIGPALADALATRSDAVQRVDSIGLWLVWSVGLVSTLVVSTVSLTANRVLAPAALLAAAAAVIGGATGASAVLAIAFGAGVVAVVSNRAVADVYVNGSAYGHERRFLLRTPAALLVGPLEVAVVGVVCGAATGPMLLAAGAYVAGAVALVVGWPLAVVLVRALHGLSRRWIVFVPVGLVVHDYTALVDSLLLQRKDVASVGWAPVGTDALDLSVGGLGRIVQLTFREPVAVLPRPSRRPGSPGPSVEAVDTGAVLVAPARAAALLAAAAEHRLPVITA